jgi:uncharacterized protein
VGYFALLYDVVDDFVTRRQPFRPVHLAAVEAAHARGEIVMAGALGDPPSGALLIFHGEDPQAATAFAAADPYVVQGLVTEWRVLPWTVVVGPQR